MGRILQIMVSPNGLQEHMMWSVSMYVNYISKKLSHSTAISCDYRNICNNDLQCLHRGQIYLQYLCFDCLLWILKSETSYSLLNSQQKYFLWQRPMGGCLPHDIIKPFSDKTGCLARKCQSVSVNPPRWSGYWLYAFNFITLLLRRLHFK